MFPTLILNAPFLILKPLGWLQVAILTVSYLDSDHHGLDDIFDLILAVCLPLVSVCLPLVSVCLSLVGATYPALAG